MTSRVGIPIHHNSNTLYPGTEPLTGVPGDISYPVPARHELEFTWGQRNKSDSDQKIRQIPVYVHSQIIVRRNCSKYNYRQNDNGTVFTRVTFNPKNFEFRQVNTIVVMFRTRVRSLVQFALYQRDEVGTIPKQKCTRYVVCMI